MGIVKKIKRTHDWQPFVGYWLLGVHLKCRRCGRIRLSIPFRSTFPRRSEPCE